MYGEISESPWSIAKKYFIFWVYSSTASLPAGDRIRSKRTVDFASFLWVVTEANSIDFNIVNQSPVLLLAGVHIFRRICQWSPSARLLNLGNRCPKWKNLVLFFPFFWPVDPGRENRAPKNIRNYLNGILWAKMSRYEKRKAWVKMSRWANMSKIRWVQMSTNKYEQMSKIRWGNFEQ